MPKVAPLRRATNGAAAIHDFEIALAGLTSEDVGESLGPGRFGMADETGRLLNGAITDGVAKGRLFRRGRRTVGLRTIPEMRQNRTPGNTSAGEISASAVRLGRIAAR